MDITNSISASSSKTFFFFLKRMLHWVLHLSLWISFLRLKTSEAVGCNWLSFPADGAQVAWLSKLITCFCHIFLGKLQKAKMSQIKCSFLILTEILFYFFLEKKHIYIMHTFHKRWCCETNVSSIPLFTYIRMPAVHLDVRWGWG